MTILAARTNMEGMTDHDLLIELRTEMRAMRCDINELKDDTKERITVMEADIVSLKFWRGVMLGGIGVLTALVIPMLIAYIGSGNIHITGN